ncbi:quinone-dependent dihydroorotate dehydrogenase [Kamptonema sp. UHCC 0994]|uniref:quinone-dependent dihydroorotate dehydrogenase n=1 Tax=Kamptonema sp. UHCC 0994 TaxID=3031329 RepID=UPI0023B8990C|nr:quinone-dependent dihydroorotate dehydrogenase [Kamptonema sp. UHCC 0994]MDF0553715.1 quinone-dependent dihydroorotate dehydrogenase [Kamptonema sp. UHCC 0994]
MDIYKLALRPLLFSGLKADPEWLHDRLMAIIDFLGKADANAPLRPLLVQLEQSLGKKDTRLEQTLWGLRFKNPVGLAAGFDKNALGAGIWGSFGFGFAEMGTVTFHAQLGNPRPRLFRLGADNAALNRMGFNNQGAVAIATRLEALRSAGNGERGGGGAGEEEVKSNPVSQSLSLPVFPFPLGVNLGKSKVTPLEEAAMDYLGSFKLLKDWGDYFVVNVSSPNTPGLRSLQDANQLSTILEVLQQENRALKPILVKIAPDLEWEAIASVIKLAQTYELAGIVATNTTTRRDGLKTQILPQTGKPISEEAGGISGDPVRDRSTEVIRFIWQQTQGQLPIIGVGGIFTAEDAWEKIAAGASLIQVYTGWIYEGPWMVRRILEGLLQKLEERGLSSISEAVGIDAN